MSAPADIAEDLVCPECGYSLRGIDASERCPECGHALDRARLTASRIPWTYRREIGRWKAYWRTVYLVIRRPSRVAADVVRPVSLEQARKFRQITVLVAMTAALALLAWGCVETVHARPITMSSTASPQVRIGWLLEIVLVPAIVVGLYAFLLTAAGVASYFFHPRWLPVERQNRAVALSYYAAAPLALTPISVATLVVGLFMVRQLVAWGGLIESVIAGLAAVAVPLVQAVASITSPVRMLQRTTHCGPGRAIALALSLPVLWALLAVVIAIGIPAAYLFVAVVIMSLIG